MIPHGVAVGTGLVLALEASAAASLLVETELLDRTVRLLEALGASPSLGHLRERWGCELPTEELLEGMRHDKKGSAGEPALVLVRGLGQVSVDHRIDPDALRCLLG